MRHLVQYVVLEGLIPQDKVLGPYEEWEALAVKADLEKHNAKHVQLLPYYEIGFKWESVRGVKVIVDVVHDRYTTLYKWEYLEHPEGRARGDGNRLTLSRQIEHDMNFLKRKPGVRRPKGLNIR